MVQTHCVLQPAPDVSAFERAWNEVIKRHDIFRTAFEWKEVDDAVQVLYDQAEISLTQCDWRGQSKPEQRKRLQEYLVTDRRRGFDFSAPPLLRLMLINLDDESSQFIWTVHHLLMDTWSEVLLFDEFSSFYNAFANGRTIQTEPAPSYRDYVKWIKQQDLSEADAFWRQSLKGFETPTQFGTARNFRSETRETYESQQISLSVETTIALQALGRQQEVTLNTVTQGAWALLLSRYSGERDVVFGMTVSGRPFSLEGAEHIIGPFLNTLPLRVQLPPDTTLSAWLQELQLRSTDLLMFEYSPLVRVQRLSDVQNGLPLFESIYVFESAPVNPLQKEKDSANGSLAIRDAGTIQSSNYPIAVLISPGRQLSLEIIYDSSAFASETIARMLEHLRNLLEGMASRPTARLRDLPMLSETERRVLLHDWNKTAVDYGLGCLHEVIEAQAKRTPDAVALCFEEQQLTYRELDERANQLAHYLKRRGVGAEVLVGIMMQRSLEMVVALLGILKAGGAYVPLDASYPAARLRYMLQDCGARLLLTQGRLAALVPEVTASETEVQVIKVDEQWAEIALESKAASASTVNEDNLAYLIYTSGSTGKPKGVMIAHAGVTNHMAWLQEVHPLDERDAMLQKTSFSFDASMLEFYWPLMYGARLVLARDKADLDTEYLTSLMDAQQITTVYFPASALQMFLANRKAGTCQWLKYACSAAEVMPLAVEKEFYAQFPLAELHNLYGPTEVSIDVTWWRCEPESRRRSVPIGRPIANTQVYVLDEGLEPVPVGVAGELYLSGVGLARGYWGQAGLTAERFVPNAFGESGGRLYRTGDLVRHLAEGELEFLGRVDSQVKLRGYRIELGEIDAVLGSHQAISECVTIFQDGQASEKRIVSYIVPANGHVETANLRSYLRERLPEYMVPSTLVRLECLPRTPNGKIDRRGLPAPDMAQRDLTLPYTEPRSELERRLAQIWREVLKVEKVGLHDNFFDLGGHSLLLVQVHARLREELRLEVSAIDLFKYPTIGSLAKHAQDSGTSAADQEWLVQARARAEVRRGKKEVESDIAIIGMAGRFPGAANVSEFWLNLRHGVESMREFSEDEMLAAGVSEELLQQDRYVRRGTELKDLEYFDAEFFGLTPREAEAMDPQQRMFLECAWEALEDTGYDSGSYPLPIGMFAGAATNTYMFQLISNRELFRSIGGFQTKLLNDKDFLTTRVSYKLGLKGPSLTVQTACSTSLVAVHLACQSLLNGECSMALAGGVAIILPQRTGYLPQDGGLTSPDGHCRPFDARAAGIVGGSGAGLLVLKRLSDALADGDSIRAVIKGTAINNDGSLKVGYTAPSIEGQAAAIAEAQAVAGVHPESISYIETHGTATTLGDPIEIAALTQAFRAQTNARQFCAIGSVKSNIGHLDTAAGVAGLIKTVLALEHGELPPSLNYEQPNPEIDFAQSPFYVNAQLREWPRREGELRRAGVSSFGMGGTNAHLVLEEAPAVVREKPADDWQVLLLSARSADSLAAAKQKLATHLTDHPEQELADVAYTLQVGRHDFVHRAAVVSRSALDAAVALRSDDPRVLLQSVCEPAERPVAFLFPGIGDHYVNMAAGIYAAEKTFRNEVDRCCELLKECLGTDLRKVFYASQPATQAPSSPGLDLRRMLNRGGREDDAQSKQLNETFIAQPAVFVIEYAMARLLMQWGIKPQAMMGYSIGEYVAACIAGVLSLEDALFLVGRRAQLIQTLPTGALLTVPLSEDELGDYLSEQLWVVAINGAALCVLGGTSEAVDDCEQKLLSKGIACRRLPTSHPFHSELLSPIADQFTSLVSKVKLNAPAIPYISNVTGTWITEAEVQDPNYWAKHMCQTVRFGAGLSELWKEPRRIMLEVGPGQSLTSLALQGRPENTTVEQLALPTIRNSYEQHSDSFFLSGTLAKLWLAGVAPDWIAVHRDKQRRRVSLPTYSFDRRYYWLPQSNGDQTKPSVHFEKKHDIESWFYLPSWKRTVPLLSLASDGRRHEKQHSLIFVDRGGLGLRIAALLEDDGHEVVTVTSAESFTSQSARSYTINQTRPDDYETLFSKLQEVNWGPTHIVHLWSLDTDNESLTGSELFDRAQASGFYSLLFLAQALGRRGSERVQIAVISNQMQEVTGDETITPENATLLGPCKVIPQEYPEITCRSIDVVIPSYATEEVEKLARQLILEVQDTSSGETIAHRGGHRWTQQYEPIRLNPNQCPTRLREGGTYLIVGGLGRIGLTLAEYLARKSNIRLVLTGRSGLPPRDTWEEWLNERSETMTASRIRKVLDLEALGADVRTFKTNVGDRDEMQRLVAGTLQEFGALNGVIYLAGLLGDASFSPVPETTKAQCEPNFEAKGHGLYVLEEVLDGVELDFCILFSSLASVLGGLGFTAYAAANAFVDAFVRRHNRTARTPWVSEDWDTWLVREDEPHSMDFKSTQSDLNMTPAQATAAFQAILSAGALTQVVVSVGDLQTRLDRWIKRELPSSNGTAATVTKLTSHPRPGLRNAFVAPRGETEQGIAEIWQEVLGIEMIGIYDNFFELGGHSLLGTQVISRIRKRFREDVSVRTLFTSPTVADLAEIIVQRRLEQVDSATLSQLISEVRQLAD